MRFIDEATVKVFAGDGGSGLVSWRREKFIPQGGPDGGNGGTGGAVLFVTDSGLNTLIDFSFNPLIRAEAGDTGGANDRSGKDGEDVVRIVPVGTQVFFEDTLVADLNVPGARWIAARGGRGGKGNTHFKSSTNQAPHYAQPGQQGEKRTLKLCLKSVADVGLLGLPNVGKSTLVSKTTSSHPRIADYPFTTIRPSLGVVLVDNSRRFVMADIPGLIPGAHEGKGLGIRFLQHVERTSVLAQFIDISTAPDGSSLYGLEQPSVEMLSERAMTQFEAIEQELQLFSEELAQRPRLVLFSKADLPEAREAFLGTKRLIEERGHACLLISSHTGEGLEELKNTLFSMVTAAKSAATPLVAPSSNQI